MNFFVKALLKQKLKGSIPDDQLDMFIAMVEKNPAFFEQIAKEIQEKVSKGMSQQDAAMQVMKGHQDELAGLMKP
jgi:hypothetical protein